MEAGIARTLKLPAPHNYHCTLHTSYTTHNCTHGRPPLSTTTTMADRPLPKHPTPPPRTGYTYRPREAPSSACIIAAALDQQQQCVIEKIICARASKAASPRPYSQRIPYKSRPSLGNQQSADRDHYCAVLATGLEIIISRMSDEREFRFNKDDRHETTTAESDSRHNITIYK